MNLSANKRITIEVFFLLICSKPSTLFNVMSFITNEDSCV